MSDNPRLNAFCRVAPSVRFKAWRVSSLASFSARLISVHENLQLSRSDALISWPLNNLQVGEEEGF